MGVAEINFVNKSDYDECFSDECFIFATYNHYDESFVDESLRLYNIYIVWFYCGLSII